MKQVETQILNQNLDFLKNNDYLKNIKETDLIYVYLPFWNTKLKDTKDPKGQLLRNQFGFNYQQMTLVSKITSSDTVTDLI